MPSSGTDDFDALVADRAATQHGLITRAQARNVGGTDRMIGTRVGSGRWRPVDRAVFVLAGAPRSWEQRILAACLSAGPEAVVSHRSAAALWGLDGCRPGPVELTVPNGRRYRRPGVRTHESTDLELARPVTRSAIRVTGAARTLLDLGAVVSPARTEQAINDALRRRLTRWPILLETLVLHARRGRDGVGTLRAILAERYGEDVPDSFFNQVVRRLLEDAGLPSPKVEHEVCDERGNVMARIDLAYPAERVAVELDGLADHATDLGVQRDRPRQNRLELTGWLVLRYTWRTLTHEPARICAEVAEALAQRRRQAP